MVVIHNGIDVCDYDSGKTRGDIRSAFGLSEDPVIIGSTGRIVPRKGYELLKRAASTVVNNGLIEKGGSVRFVIVGDTPYFFRDDHLVELKRLVADEGLDKYFIFAGFRNDVRLCLKDFYIFVIPSNYPEPFPRSVIDAMSFELPVVGFRVEGIVESVDDGVTGILCEPGDVEDIGRSVLRLIEDADLRRSMGMSGRDRVIENFSA